MFAKQKAYAATPGVIACTTQLCNPSCLTRICECSRDVMEPLILRRLRPVFKSQGGLPTKTGAKKRPKRGHWHKAAQQRNSEGPGAGASGSPGSDPPPSPLVGYSDHHNGAVSRSDASGALVGSGSGSGGGSGSHGRRRRRESAASRVPPPSPIVAAPGDASGGEAYLSVSTSAPGFYPTHAVPQTSGHDGSGAASPAHASAASGGGSVATSAPGDSSCGPDDSAERGTSPAAGSKPGDAAGSIEEDEDEAARRLELSVFRFTQRSLLARVDKRGARARSGRLLRSVVQVLVPVSAIHREPSTASGGTGHHPSQSRMDPIARAAALGGPSTPRRRPRTPRAHRPPVASPRRAGVIRGVDTEYTVRGHGVLCYMSGVVSTLPRLCLVCSHRLLPTSAAAAAAHVRVPRPVAVPPTPKASRSSSLNSGSQWAPPVMVPASAYHDRGEWVTVRLVRNSYVCSEELGYTVVQVDEQTSSPVPICDVVEPLPMGDIVDGIDGLAGADVPPTPTKAPTTGPAAEPNTGAGGGGEADHKDGGHQEDDHKQDEDAAARAVKGDAIDSLFAAPYVGPGLLCTRDSRATHRVCAEQVCQRRCAGTGATAGVHGRVAVTTAAALPPPPRRRGVHGCGTARPGRGE